MPSPEQFFAALSYMASRVGVLSIVGGAALIFLAVMVISLAQDWMTKGQE